jgi:hypothetical protein
LDLFIFPAGTIDKLNKQAPPWSPPHLNVKRFPMRKNEASSNQDSVHLLFEALKSKTTARTSRSTRTAHYLKTPPPHHAPY